DGGWHAEQDRRQPEDSGVEKILDRMQAHRRSHVNIGIRVMQRVNAPQKRHRVLTAMHEITQKVEQEEACHQTRPSVGERPGGEGDPQRCLKLWPEGVGWRKDEGGKDQIKDPDPQITEPPPERRELPPPSRPAEFPGPDNDQTAYQYDEDQLIAPCRT